MNRMSDVCNRNNGLLAMGAVLGALVADNLYNGLPYRAPFVALGAIVGIVAMRILLARTESSSRAASATVEWSTDSSSLRRTMQANADQAIDGSAQLTTASSQATAQALIRGGVRYGGNALSGSVLSSVPAAASVINPAINASAQAAASSIQRHTNPAIASSVQSVAGVSKRFVHSSIDRASSSFTDEKDRDA